jgi:hypothetical protein
MNSDKEIDMIRTFFADRYNSKPLSERKELAAHEMICRLQHLEIEKSRLKMNYDKSVRDINEHKKNIQQSLKKRFVEASTEEATNDN